MQTGRRNLLACRSEHARTHGFCVGAHLLTSVQVSRSELDACFPSRFEITINNPKVKCNNVCAAYVYPIYIYADRFSRRILFQERGKKSLRHFASRRKKGQVSACTCAMSRGWHFLLFRNERDADKIPLQMFATIMLDISKKSRCTDQCVRGYRLVESSEPLYFCALDAYRLSCLYNRFHAELFKRPISRISAFCQEDGFHLRQLR